MGSGCSSNNNSIFLSGGTSDKTIIYTGIPIPGLGICTNDKLSEIEAVILQQVVNFSTGLGICIPNIDLTACALFSSYVTGCCSSNCNELDDLMSIIFNSLCTLYTDYTTLKAEIDAFLNTSYSAPCLGLSNPTLAQLLQALLTAFCTLQGQVTVLQTQFNTLSSGLSTTIGNQVLAMFQTCTGPNSVVKSGSGSSATIALKGFVPIGGFYGYVGPTAGLFDSTGLGITGTAACGMAQMNGLNGTTNLMGQVPIGLTTMGGTLPSNASGLSVPTVNTQIGEVNHTLSPSESSMPSHSHTITDKSHDHVLQFDNRVDGRITGGGANNRVDLTGGGGSNTSSPSKGIAPNPSIINGYIAQSFTGINSTNAAAGTSATGHNNIQPSTGVIWIQRIS